MTSDLLILTGALLAGWLVGAAFFGGLWWTVRRLPDAKNPGLLMVGSLVLRTTLVLGVFFLVGRGHFDRILVCLAGLIVARYLVMRWTRAKAPKENAHAPES